MTDEQLLAAAERGLYFTKLWRQLGQLLVKRGEALRVRAEGMLDRATRLNDLAEKALARSTEAESRTVALLDQVEGTHRDQLH